MATLFHTLRTRSPAFAGAAVLVVGALSLPTAGYAAGLGSPNANGVQAPPGSIHLRSIHLNNLRTGSIQRTPGVARLRAGTAQSNGTRAAGAASTAGGSGLGAGAAGAAAPPVGTTSPSPTLPRSPAVTGGLLSGANRPAAHAHAASKHSSMLAILIGVLGGLLVLACGAWAFARRRGLEPRWWLSLRHSVDEAGHRASGTWAEFADWARIGH
jgi:hypothetical protein